MPPALRSGEGHTLAVWWQRGSPVPPRLPPPVASALVASAVGRQERPREKEPRSRLWARRDGPSASLRAASAPMPLILQRPAPDRRAATTDASRCPPDATAPTGFWAGAVPHAVFRRSAVRRVRRFPRIIALVSPPHFTTVAVGAICKTATIALFIGVACFVSIARFAPKHLSCATHRADTPARAARTAWSREASGPL